ncbi:MAG: metal-sulfur cluster assembly factor [Kineosporiaceae bacterium]
MDERQGVSVEAVRGALDEVLDPCALRAGAEIGIVEMGLVPEISVTGGHVDVAVTVTEPTCIMHHAFARQAHERLAALPGVERVTVRLAPYRPWHEDVLAPEVRRRIDAARRDRGIPLPEPVIPPVERTSVP